MSAPLPETAPGEQAAGLSEALTMKDLDRYLKQFERFSQARAQREPTWLRPIRKAGLARFAEVGYPTTQDEDWRFTNPSPIVRLPFKPVTEPPPVPPGLALDQFPFVGLDTIRLVFVDGHFAPELSSAKSDMPGLTIASLAAVLAQPSNRLLEQNLAFDAGQDENAFAALNNAFFTDGLFIHVPSGRQVPLPVHLLHLATGRDKGAALHSRNLVLAEAGSQLTLLESHLSLQDNVYLNNTVTELVVGDHAVVEHCKYQDESPAAFHVAALHARLGRACRFWSHSIATGARLARNNIRTRLQGEGLECVLNGLYLTRQDQIADHHMIVEHASPHCASHEYFNGILDDRSRGVFHGRILVQPDAQKTDAKQTNKNLLLSSEATANAKPQLEIYADDVKCTHGATIGQLDEDSIFYLRARGIGPDMARRMLIHAFAGEIIERIQCEPARDELDQIIWNRLEEYEAVAVEQK